MKLRITPQALKDMEDIERYIASNLHNPDAATNIIADIVSAFDNLIDFPMMGAALENKIEVEKEYRYLVCGNYLIFYKIIDEFISVYHILHSKQDYAHRLLSDDNLPLD